MRRIVVLHFFERELVNVPTVGVHRVPGILPEGNVEIAFHFEKLQRSLQATPKE